MLDDKTKELIAFGASVACNCHGCVKYHFEKVKKLGVQPEEIKTAMKTGIMVRQGAASQIDELLSELGEEIGIKFGD